MTPTVNPSPMSDLQLLSDDELYAAFGERDMRLDGTFFIAVTTTGIYCRPGCPARRPLRKNVRFYLGVDAAEQAGFRACKRCHPRDAPRHAAVSSGA